MIIWLRPCLCMVLCRNVCKLMTSSQNQSVLYRCYPSDSCALLLVLPDIILRCYTS